MAIDPMLAVSALAGLFGKKPSYDPNQKRMMRIAEDFENYGRGVPGSSPDEMASLAQQRALMGQQVAGARDRMYSALSPTATTGAGGLADMMKNFESSAMAQQGSMDMEQLMQFINARRQALLSSAQISGSVGQKGGGTQNNLPQLVGQYMYQRELNKAYQPPKAPPPAGGGGAGAQSNPLAGGSRFGGIPAGFLGSGQLQMPGAPAAQSTGGGGAPGGNLLQFAVNAAGGVPNLGGFMSQGAPGPTFPGGMTPQAGTLTGPNQRRYGPPRSRTRY
jgi:hypothetical protein